MNHSWSPPKKKPSACGYLCLPKWYHKSMKNILVGFIVIVFVVVIYLAVSTLGTIQAPEAVNEIQSGETQSTQTQASNAQQVAPKRDAAKDFLQGMIGELGITAQVSPATKKIALGYATGNDMAGYSVFIPRDANLKSYFAGFDNDWKNSADATFNSSLGYINENLVCVDYLRTIAPNNDVSKCDDGGTTCTVTREVFCANL